MDNRKELIFLGAGNFFDDGASIGNSQYIAGGGAKIRSRLRHLQEHTFGEKMLSAMRFGFGGHIEGKEPTAPKQRQKNLRPAP
jgi:hypothetical protein